ncbi:MAG TPA: hypothetical protein DEB39_13105 [Planctomycetaceae bacterium]|nr:hypothetical protein [Planctomycetaceae bacterium]
MYKQLLSCVLLLGVLCFVGCSGKVKMHGSVKYPDGSPLAKGTVFLSNGMQMFQGELTADGSFNIGELSDGDGIPPGSYMIWLAANTTDYEVDPVTEKPTGKQIKNIVIDPKFENRDTSGLSVVVEAGKSVPLEIVVEKPAK